MKRPVLWIVLSVFVLVAVILLVFLHSPAFETYVLGRIDGQLQRDYGLTLKAQGFELSPLLLHLDFEGLEVRPLAPDISQLQLFSAERLVVDVSLISLLFKKIHLQTLEIESPRIVLLGKSGDKAGRENPPASAPVGFRIDKLRLTQGAAEYRDGNSPLDLLLFQVGVDILFREETSDHSGMIRVGRGEIQYSEYTFPVKELKADFTFNENEVHVSLARLESEVVSLEASASLQDYQRAPRMQFSIDSSVRLAAVKEFLGWEQESFGRIILQGEGRAEGKTFDFTGRLDGEKLQLHNLEVERISAGLRIDEKTAAVSELKILALGGSVDGFLHVPLNDSSEAALDVKWQDLDIARLENFFPLLSSLYPTRTEGRLRVKGTTLELDTISADGQLRIRPLPGKSGLSDSRLKLSTDLAFNLSQGVLQVSPSEFAFNRLRLATSGRLDLNKNVDLEFKIDLPDLKELQQLSSRLQEALSLPQLQTFSQMPLAGQLSLTGKIRGPLAGPDVSFVLTGNALEIDRLSLSSLFCRGDLKNSGVNIHEFVVHSGQGEMSASGLLGFDVFQALETVPSDFRIEVADIEIEPVVSLLTGREDVRGLLTAKVRIAGMSDDPRSEFQLSLNQVQLEQADFPQIELAGHFSNQVFRLESLMLQKGTGRLTGILDYNVSSRDFRADLEGREFELKEFSAYLPSGTEASGRVGFRIQGQGLLDRPVFEFSLAAKDILINRARLGSLTAEIRSDGQTIGAQISAPDLRTLLKGQMSLERPFLVTGNIQTDRLDLLSLFRAPDVMLPLPTQSGLTASLSFSVPWKDWKNVSADLIIDTGFFRYKGFLWETTAPIIAGIERSEFVLQNFRIKGPETSLQAKGKLPLSKEGKGEVQISGALELLFLEALIPGSGFSGTIEIQGDVSGSLLSPNLQAGIAMQNGNFSHDALPYDLHDMRLRMEIKDNSLHLQDFYVGLNGGSLAASGRIPLLLPASPQEEDEGRFVPGVQNDVTFFLKGLDLSRLTALMPEAPEADMGGLVEGSVRFWRSGARFDSWEAEGRLDRLDLQLSQFRMGNKDPVVFSLKDRQFILEGLRLEGGSSFLTASGRWPLDPLGPMEAHLLLDLDSAVFTPLMKDAALGGRLSLDMNVAGTADSPTLRGLGRVEQGFFQLRDLPFLVNDIHGEIRFSEADPLTITMQGFLNGGKVEIQGEMSLQAFNLSTANITIKADQIQLSYPEGLQALAEGTVRLSKREKAWLISGNVSIPQSFYGADVYAVTELLNNLSRRRRALRSDINPRIRNLNLDLGIVTGTPLLVDNNLAQIELDSSVRVTGTVFEPRLSGFVKNRQVGTLVFGRRNYEVEQMTMDFPGTDPLDGRLNVVAHTQMKHEYDELNITLTISGPLTNLNFTTSSSPPRSQLELTSLLLTGHGVEKLRKEAANVIGDQLMLYFLSPFASPITERLRSFLNAEQVTIEPINIAAEEDPGARFTFRKGLINVLDLVYSIDIGDTQRQTWVFDYSLSRNFFLQSYAKDNGSYGGSLGHRFFLAGPKKADPSALATGRRDIKIMGLELSGPAIFSEEKLKKLTKKLKPGRSFSYREMRKTLDRLASFYKENGFVNVIIDPSFVYSGQAEVSLTFHVEPGTPARIEFVGGSLSNKLKKEVVARWNGRLPEEMAMAEAQKYMSYILKSKGYFETEVNASKPVQGDSVVYSFQVETGPRYRIQEFHLEGESVVSAKEIRKAVSGIPAAKGKGLWILLYDFKRARLRIESLYAEAGYQSAVISPPRISARPEARSLEVVLPVQQDSLSRIQSVEIQGNASRPTAELKQILSMREGDISSPTQLAADTNRLYSHYRAKGHHQVEIEEEIALSPEGADLALRYAIDEGPVFSIGRIRIAGNQRTPEYVIKRELEFKEGDVLNMEALISSQKSLYDLLIFRTVNITRQEFSSESPVIEIVVEVEEEPRLGIGYGLRYNSEDKLEGFGQIDFTSLLGRGRNALLFYKQNKRQNILRFSLKDPYLVGKKISTLYSFNYSHETNFGIVNEEVGFTIQQDLPLLWQSSLAYLFRYNRLHSYELEASGPIPWDIVSYLPEFQTFFLRDTRLSKLNAKQGSFASVSLTYSPQFLKTDHHYLSLFCQYSMYKVLRQRIIWASNYRIGLAHGFDGRVIWPRRFFAGGGNSIRGFEKDRVGPYDPDLQRPEGGEGLFVMNQELRVGVTRWLEGVGFIDLGNVYESLSDFDPFDVRVGAGLGLRLNTPIAFFRFDYGFNLKPQGSERRSVFYFSIGQAF